VRFLFNRAEEVLNCAKKKAFCIHAEISVFRNHAAAERDSCAGPFLGVV